LLSGAIRGLPLLSKAEWRTPWNERARKDTTTMTRKTSTLTIVTYHVVEETIDDKPSLPPMPIVDADGETVEETLKPIAKCRAVPWNMRRTG
jgi:hypothetical protein